MPTPQKTEIINDLTQKFQNSSGIYFTRYTGMNVDKVTELRRKFRENEVSYFISKNTLTKIAANNFATSTMGNHVYSFASRIDLDVRVQLA